MFEELCRAELIRWHAGHTISERDLRQCFGNTICVMRSVGIMQDGWVITGDAVTTGPDSGWLVTVRLIQENLKKIVSLEDIELWTGKSSKLINN